MKQLGSIVFAIIAVGVLGWFWPQGPVTEENQLSSDCSTCHVMQTWVTSWQQSNHAKVACLSCHQDLDWTEMIGKNWTGAKGIKYPQNQSVACLQCHNPQRAVTPSGDLIVPHELHAIKGVDCLDCHQSMGHEITEKGQGTVPAVPMDRCLECHNGAMAPSDCKACHREITYPHNHVSKTWRTQHGQEALNNFNCSNCHNYQLKELLLERDQTKDFNLIRNYTFRTSICWECHQKKPASHQTTAFVQSHGTGQQQGCYICHQQNPNEDVSKLPAKVECSRCHSQVNHPTNWRAVHKDEVKTEGSTPCYRCHQPVNCFACHSRT